MAELVAIAVVVLVAVVMRVVTLLPEQFQSFCLEK